MALQFVANVSATAASYEKFIADLKLLGDFHYTPNRVEDTAAAGQLAFVTDDLDSNWERARSRSSDQRVCGETREQAGGADEEVVGADGNQGFGVHGRPATATLSVPSARAISGLASPKSFIRFCFGRFRLTLRPSASVARMARTVGA